MKKDIKIAAEARTLRGKNEARRLRKTGKIPAVVYGAGQESAAVAVDPKAINQILNSAAGHNTIFKIEVSGGETTPVMIVDWQHDPVKEDLLHIDLERIQLDKMLTVKVPVQTLGDPVGVKVQGGLLEVVHRDITVECLPADIPSVIEIDVSKLELGDTVRANDLELPDGVTLMGKKTMVVCHVVAVRTSEAAGDEEAEEGEGEAEAAETPGEEGEKKE